MRSWAQTDDLRGKSHAAVVTINGLVVQCDSNRQVASLGVGSVELLRGAEPDSVSEGANIKRINEANRACWQVPLASFMRESQAGFEIGAGDSSRLEMTRSIMP